MTPEFAATLQLEDGLLLVVVEGELDLATAGELDEVVGDPFAEGAGRVQGAVVDLEACTFVDSSGARMIASVGERLGRGGVPVRVAAVPGSAIREVLELLGIPYRMPVADSCAAARAELAGGDARAT